MPARDDFLRELLMDLEGIVMRITGVLGGEEEMMEEPMMDEAMMMEEPMMEEQLMAGPPPPLPEEELRR